MRWPAPYQALSGGAAAPAHGELRAAAFAYLDRLNLPADIDGAARSHMGKMLLRLRDGAGYVKLALSPRARLQLAAEARAYADSPPAPRYRQPRFRVLRDGPDWAAALLEALPIRRFARRDALRPRPGPFEAAPTAETTADGLLRHAVGGSVSGRLSERLCARWGRRRFRTGPSHGDFIYWNLGHLPGGETALFDLEYYAPQRSRHFDRFFWSFVPLCRQAILRPWLAAGLVVAARAMAARISPDGADGLALMLAEHAATLDVEHHLPEVAELFDPVTLRLRQRQVAFYERLVGRLLSGGRSASP